MSVFQELKSKFKSRKCKIIILFLKYISTKPPLMDTPPHISRSSLKRIIVLSVQTYLIKTWTLKKYQRSNVHHMERVHPEQ